MEFVDEDNSSEVKFVNEYDSSEVEFVDEDNVNSEGVDEIDESDIEVIECASD